MSYYLDQIAKINYYKQRIIEELTKNGIFPNDILIQNKLEDINTALAIFQYIKTKEASVFDVEKFNEDMLRIYNDLLILYKLAYAASKKEYEDIKSYAETHLLQLEELATSYEYKTKLELDSTSLGETIYFKANGFNVKNNNGVSIIDLGKIDLHSASKIACLFEGTGIKDEQVVFSFNDNNCSPYSYNKDFFIVPGTIYKTTYTYNMPTDTIKKTSYEMAIDNLVPDKKNKYIIYGGKNRVSSQLGSIKTFYNKIDGLGINLNDTGTIIFYIYDGTFINFDFSTEPLETNFNGNHIENLDKVHKIVIKYYAGFSFNFETDGTIYATREKGFIENNKLYYPNTDDVDTFLIEEYTNKNTVTYNNAKVTISNLLKDEPLDIKTIAIKEISALDGV